MTANGVAAWKDPDGDGVATATLNSSGGVSSESDVPNLVADLALKAPLASPTFTGTVTLPSSTVTSAMITDGTIVNADVNAAAAIAYSKLALTGAVLNADLAGSIAASKISGTAVTAADTGTVTSAMIADATIVNADVSATAGILASKTFDREYYLNGKTFMRSSLVREAVRDAAGAAPATAVMMSVPIVLYAGDVITNVIFETGTTAAGTSPTHWWFALYDTQATPALIAQTTDQTSTAWGATTVKSLALNSPAPYTVVTSGVHWVSVMMANAVTMPTFLGAILTASGATGTANQVMLCQTSGSGLTTTAPGTITGGTVKNAVPYARVT